MSAFGGEWSCLPSDWMDPANGLPDLVTEVPGGVHCYLSLDCPLNDGVYKYSCDGFEWDPPLGGQRCQVWQVEMFLVL